MHQHKHGLLLLTQPQAKQSQTHTMQVIYTAAFVTLLPRSSPPMWAVLYYNCSTEHVPGFMMRSSFEHQAGQCHHVMRTVIDCDKNEIEERSCYTVLHTLLYHPPLAIKARPRMYV
jgi:hypothetical protein